MMIRTFALLLLVFGAGIAYGQPVVSGVSGTLENGNAITVTGSSFGNNGPDVVLFDNFEGGSNGAPMGTDATYSDWDIIYSPVSAAITYSNAASVSGSLAFRADMDDHWLRYMQADLPASTRYVFVSWWLYIPAGDNFPGEGQTDVNWKQMWIQGASTTDDDLVCPTLMSGWSLGGNDPPYLAWLPGPTMTKGAWWHMAVYLNGGTSSDGEVKFWRIPGTGSIDQLIDDSNVTVLDDGAGNGPYFEKVRVNGYGRQAQNCHPMFDDVYIAAGSNCQARIEIGDDPVYLNCTNLAIAVPTAWSNNSVTATMYTGSFSGGPAFLFVVDASGGISQGFPIELGGTVDPDTPGQPGQPITNK